MRTHPLLLLVAPALLAAPAAAGITVTGVPLQSATLRRLNTCEAFHAIEFQAPMPTEEVPVFHGPMPQSWHVILELSIDQPHLANPVGVVEGQYIPSPGIAAVPPTDVNGDLVIGDPHPAFPNLRITMDDDLFVLGFLLPAGTNLASFVELIGSEIEHGTKQSTTVAWVVTPAFMIVDINGDLGTNLSASFRNASDGVFVRHGADPRYVPCSQPNTPTVSIFASDWISTVDSNVLTSDGREAFLVGIEVRIPCYWDGATVPPTPIPLDPLVGPGPTVLTGNFPFVPGPGPHPAFPSMYLTFSDDYADIATASFYPGGIVTGGTCATLYGFTGPNLAPTLGQSSVSAWYGVDGIPNFAPTFADDQLIYRFTGIYDGMIIDTDVLPMEMMITASIETECNLYSITNVRVKHRPDVVTPDPGP